MPKLYEAILTLTSPSGDVLTIFSAEPTTSGDFKLVAQHGSGRRIRTNARTLPRGLHDTVSGEIVTNPVAYIRDLWAASICKANGGWPLDVFVNALSIEGVGPAKAKAIAEALSSIENFVEAAKQASEIELPIDRDAIADMRMSREYVDGRNSSESNCDGFSVSVTIERSFDGPSLDDATGLFPEPLATFLNGTGPSVWAAVKVWASSETAAKDVSDLLKYGPVLKHTRGDR